ncbi:hypothetical protein QL996_00545 [Planococcus sp. APC 4015]|nr:hypothetical protein [Planococcus sp. APC 4015]
MRRLFFVVAAAAASALVITGCASGASPGAGLGTVWPEPPAGEVMAQGTVLDSDGSVQLCLGAVAESYPPQCSGIPVTGWSWDRVEGSETASGVTWGAYAVQGMYDGESFEVTQPPIMLALYDTMPLEDPTDGEPGAASESELVEMQDALPSKFGEAFLTAYPDNGRLWVDVVWDDGTWQRAADAEYGEQMVVVRSALREVG